MPRDLGDGFRKKLEWKRFYICAVVPDELALPAENWLWERHQPAPKRRMRVTHASRMDGVEPGITELELLMEYVARGANKTDVLRKVWEALTAVNGGNENVPARVECRTLATVWIDFAEYKHKDPVWLADKAFAAACVTDEVTAEDWSDSDDDFTYDETG